MIQTSFHPMFKVNRLLPVLMLVLLVATGCRSLAPDPSAAEGAPVWPPPPAQPRIAYEKSILEPSDMGIRRSWWRRVGRFFVGQNEGEVTFSKPVGICFDKLGNLCVTDTGSRKVHFLDTVRRRSKSWDHVGEVAFSSPVAVAKQDEVIYVADSGYGGIIAFSEAGKLLFTITEGLKRPTGVSVSGQTLWVVDAGLHRIEIFDLQGRPLRGFGQRGSAAGAFNYPTHLAQAHDGSNSMYVTDSMNFRIQKLDADGSPLQVIGSIGDVSGSFSRPKGIASDSEGNLYVVDALFDNIQIFDKEGRFLMHFGESGSELGCFWLPAGIAVDTQDRIWVADSYNHRIQVFKRAVDHDQS